MKHNSCFNSVFLLKREFIWFLFYKKTKTKKRSCRVSDFLPSYCGFQLWCCIAVFCHFCVCETFYQKVEPRKADVCLLPSPSAIGLLSSPRQRNCPTTQFSIQHRRTTAEVDRQTCVRAHSTVAPCLTERGNGFSPFGGPQTRGAAGPFQIAALLKRPTTATTTATTTTSMNMEMRI